MTIVTAVAQAAAVAGVQSLARGTSVSHGHGQKKKKKVRQRKILHDLMYMWNQEKQNRSSHHGSVVNESD